MSEIKINAIWDGGLDGNGRISGDGWDVGFAIPTEFGGSGQGADPKSLLTAATQACLTATLRAITANKKIPVQALAVETTAQATQDSFTIHHIAKLTLAAGATDADESAARSAVATADKICVVGNLARKAGVIIDAASEIHRA